LNRTHQLLVWADDVNLLGKHKNTKERNRKTLLDTSKEDALQVNTDKTKVYVYVSSP